MFLIGVLLSLAPISASDKVICPDRWTGIPKNLHQIQGWILLGFVDAKNTTWKNESSFLISHTGCVSHADELELTQDAVVVIVDFDKTRRQNLLSSPVDRQLGDKDLSAILNKGTKVVVEKLDLSRPTDPEKFRTVWALVRVRDS